MGFLLFSFVFLWHDGLLWFSWACRIPGRIPGTWGQSGENCNCFLLVWFSFELLLPMVYGFPMVFLWVSLVFFDVLWFSYGVRLFSCGFLMGFYCFRMVFLWFSIVFLWFSYGMMVFYVFPGLAGSLAE